jgi:hypothetical protein
METNEAKTKILQILYTKSLVKQQVFDKTFEAFKMLKKVLARLVTEYNEELKLENEKIHLSFKDRGPFFAELKVAGDLLIFQMHSNVFEFDREHGVWKISYVQSNNMASYSGIINIYNFLADSFKYNRFDDLGYLIGRIFVNKDNHYFVEGKRQLGFLYNDFGNALIDEKTIKQIVESAILYCLDFDLFVPPYEEVKVTNVAHIQDKRSKSLTITGKRLGFGFQTDEISGDSITYSGA